MIKPNFIIIPKNCNANDLAQRFELQSKELNFINLAISFDKKKELRVF